MRQCVAMVNGAMREEKQARTSVLHTNWLCCTQDLRAREAQRCRQGKNTLEKLRSMKMLEKAVQYVWEADALKIEPEEYVQECADCVQNVKND